MKTILITGANRGIGLAFSQHYLEQGDQVLACCRSPEQAGQLQQLATQYEHLHIYQMDVLDREGIDQLADDLSGVTIDLLIANAGIYGDSREHPFGNLDYEIWLKTLETNVLGAVKVCEAFLPHLKRSEKPLIAAISSLMGSLADNGSGGSICYRSSKAALNAAMKSIAIDIKPEGVGVLIFHPGWVQTEMGGPNALIDAATSVKGMMAQIERFDLSQTGQFIKYDGTPMPW
jgi:NAD(P)-dependent dehydrogenase (short-subunit alcohol dehydrogenase family)